MIAKHILALVAMFLLFIATITASSQEKGSSLTRNCRSICIYLESPSVVAEPRAKWDKAIDTKATLVNNTRRTIKVRAGGDDRLFYEVMSSVDTIKTRYECHICYFRSIKPRSTFKFSVYLDDLDDIFAIRVRYYDFNEPEDSDRLIHYVSWIK